MNLTLMRLIDEQFLQTPFYGSRQMMRYLNRLGYTVGRKYVRRLVRRMGLSALYQTPTTSVKHLENKVYPYLLRDRIIDQPNQVWCADITYIPMRRGFLYLVAMLDWCSRKVLSWRLSNTMEASFCVEALEEVIEKFGLPQIINTDQGSQFTSLDWIETVEQAGAKVSMDGQGRWIDNVFIKRLWRSLKYECVYLHAWECGSQTRSGIDDWMVFYNAERPHSTLGGRTPNEAYDGKPLTRQPMAAA